MDEAIRWKSCGRAQRRDALLMDRLTGIFWFVICVLAGASVFYGVSAEAQRRSVQQAEGKLDSGDVVGLVKAIDGDTILVNKSGQGNTTVRILGIKSFDAKIERDVAASYAQAAVDEIGKLLRDRPVRILLNATPKDKYGRTIASLFADEEDVALALINRGLVLVYPVYPFPSLPLYQREQEAARKAGRGLWANTEIAVRADAMVKVWRKEAP